MNYSIGDHISWWNNPKTDRFFFLKKYGYQDEKKPWKYRPLTDKGIYIIYKLELKPNFK